MVNHLTLDQVFLVRVQAGQPFMAGSQSHLAGVVGHGKASSLAVPGVAPCFEVLEILTAFSRVTVAQVLSRPSLIQPLSEV